MIADTDLARAFETTWPAAETLDTGALRTGRGLGAGGRVSSTLPLCTDWTEADIDAAIAAHERWGQRPMFRMSDDDTALQRTLAGRGFGRETPTAIMVADCNALATAVPGMTSFAIWPPLAMQCDIWAAGNITGPRQDVMRRVTLPCTAMMGRLNDRAAGAAFVAVDGPVAMIHAVEVLPAFRRMGLSGWMVRHAAAWALDHGADRLALAVSRDNAGARAAYDSLGFAEAGGYAYWARP